MVAVAAEPEANAKPNWPPSRAATDSSNNRLLGLSDLEYSYSCNKEIIESYIYDLWFVLRWAWQAQIEQK